MARGRLLGVEHSALTSSLTSALISALMSCFVFFFTPFSFFLVVFFTGEGAEGSIWGRLGVKHSQSSTSFLFVSVLFDSIGEATAFVPTGNLSWRVKKRKI